VPLKDRPTIAQRLLSPIYDNLRQFFRAHNLTFAKSHGNENYESVRNITNSSQILQHHRYHASRKRQRHIERLTNALEMLMNRVKNI
jgi:hypothetical protein